MQDTPKRVVIGSIAAAGLVALLAILDLVIGVPFAGRTVMDILFIVCAAIICYLGWESYKELE